MSKQQEEMPLLGHIGELRKHLIRIIIVVMIFAIGIGINIKWVVDNVILAPTRNDFPSIVYLNELFKKMGISGTEFRYDENFLIQQRELPEAFNLTLQIAIIGGLILAFPYIVWEMWRFVAPGLKPEERKNSGGYIISTMLLFFMGAAFGYYIISPIAIQFFINYDISNQIEKIITITSMIKMVNTSVIGMAIVFLFPVFSYVLSSLGIITPKMLKDYRKQAFIVVLVIAAIITPADIMSMFVAAIPLWLLYELSILVSQWVYRKNKKRELS